MKLTKTQLKQVIEEELEQLVLVPGVGRLRIDQIKHTVAKELMRMSKAAANGQYRKIGKTQLRNLILFLDTLARNDALGD